MNLLPISTQDKALYDFMEQLIIDSFPRDEYRDLQQLRMYTDNNSKFYNNLLVENDEPIGLLTYWDFESFYYVEHFAISPSKRNGGIGQKALDLLCSELHKPIVLEVEAPDNDLAKRRIGFYQRCGFNLWKCDYKQPPYRAGDAFLPMYLMAYGSLILEDDYERIKQALYKEVYGVRF